MSFTMVEVTGTFQTASGSAATGTVTFKLMQAMQNTNVILDPSPIKLTLDQNGHFTVSLAANDDTATVPQGVQYAVTEEITGAEPRDYFVNLSHATSPVDLSTLMPGETGSA